LLAWRRRRDGDEAAPTRAEMRALAEAHPGALRELDTLGERELARRVEGVACATTGGPIEPWMTWVLLMHRLLAAALFLKSERSAGKAGRAEPPPDSQGRARLRAQAEALAQVPLPDALVEALLSPPGGRVTPIVLAEVAARFHRPVEEVAAVLLPSRRQSA
jgi:hypothetical protein